VCCLWEGVATGANFTTDRVIANRPAVGERFVRATLQGWCVAIAYPQSAVDATMHHARETDRDLQAEMIWGIVLCVHIGKDQLGWMREESWKETRDVLAEQCLLAQPIDTSTFYTMTFVEQACGDAP